MIVTSAEYLENGKIVATIDNSKTVVADDPENMFRIEIATWESEGGVITPFYISDSDNAKRIILSRYQFRMSLVNSGESATFVNDLISNMPEGSDKEAAIVAWGDAVDYHRMDPWVLTLGLTAGFSDEKIDTLWIAGSLL